MVARTAPNRTVLESLVLLHEHAAQYRGVAPLLRAYEASIVLRAAREGIEVRKLPRK